MFQWFRNLSIISKATILISLTAISFLLILSSATYYFARKELQQTIATDQTAMVRTLANQLDEKLGASRDYLNHLARHIQSQHDRQPGRMQEILEHHNESWLFFDAGLLLISMDGRIVAETPFHANRIGLDRSARPYFTLSRAADNVVISPPYKLSIPPHQPVIAFSVILKDSQGKATGLLVGRHSLKAKGFLDNFINEPIGASGYLYLFDKNRTLLVHPEESRILTKVAEGKNSAIEAALNGWHGTMENHNSRGVAGLTTIQPLKTAQWYIAAHYPIAEAYAPLDRARTAFVAILLVSICFSFIGVWLSMRPVLKPIMMLTRHIEQLASKQGAERFLPVTGKDETGRLIRVFNEMLQELDDEAFSREENAEIYKVISEFTIEMAVWKMTDGSIRFISSNCLELTGYEDVDFYTDPLLLERIIHPDDRELWDQHHKNNGLTDSHLAFQVRLVCKDGSVCWMRHSCHLTRNQDGELTGTRGNFYDVTALLQVQEALEQEKRFIKKLINSAATPMFVINRQHKVLYWNRALEVITGLSHKQMIGTDRHWSGFYAERRPTLADLVIEKDSLLSGLYKSYSPSKYLEGGFQAEGWFELNGTRRYLMFEAAPITDESGNVTAAIESLEDITERMLMEDSLHRLGTAVEQSSSVIIITDPEGRIDFVNPRFTQITGYSAEEAIGQKPDILKSGETPASEYAELWQVISSGKVWRGEFHNRKKDGSLFWEAATISPLFDRQGRITGYLGVKEDITDLKSSSNQIAEYRDQLEKKHIELEAAFRRVEMAKREWEETLDLLNDFIILTDTDHRIRRYNKILANMTGFGVTELVGRDWRTLLQDAGFEFVAFNGKTGELLHKRSCRIYDLSVYPILLNKINTGFIVSLNDMTELRSITHELEKTLAELNDAHSQIYQQEKMASIGQLAAGVAHEINNPMGFITSNLGSLDKYVGRLSEFIGIVDQAMQACCAGEQAVPVMEARKRLKIDRILDDAHQLIAESQDGAGRVRRIVQDLKSFSRVDQAETALVDLNESLETTINIAWNELKYVAELKREFGEIPKLKCFPQQLNQVFLNLLVNAAHALGDTRGQITVRTESDGESVFVKVIDTGCGMTEEVQRRIFEPFFTTKEVGKGTGLGLSISYDIIKKHDGEITVDSESGRGTTFTVRLPLAAQNLI